VAIRSGPFLLIEWLDHVVILSQRLAQPERKNNFTIREVTEYVPDTPLTGRG